jgi:hypothetical protein
MSHSFLPDRKNFFWGGHVPPPRGLPGPYAYAKPWYLYLYSYSQYISIQVYKRKYILQRPRRISRYSDTDSPSMDFPLKQNGEKW